jgi:hypothetical protein
MTRYEDDIYLWSREQAAALEARRFDALDIAHLVEEITEVGTSYDLRLASALYQVLVHLLKWQYQPAKRSKSWRLSLLEHRRRIPYNLRRAPSLRPQLPALIAEVYPDACRKASLQTDLPAVTFRAVCPWTVEQVCDQDFLPV